MGRFIVTVIDGFGVGAMEDCALLRPTDKHANTLNSILTKHPDLSLPTLTSLGLGNITSIEHPFILKEKHAIWGTCALKHEGADTFMGHQEIMGTKPSAPIKQRLEESFEKVRLALLDHNHIVRVRYVESFRYLIVDEAVVISDNIDSDLGQAINCIASFDLIGFDDLLSIAHIVRKIVTCNRVIAFGGSHTSLDEIIQAEEIKEQTYVGNVAVRTGVYEHNYEVRHLGYGVDAMQQVPSILGRNSIPVTLIGKVADIVQNPYGKSMNCVDSDQVLDLLLQEANVMENGFICVNVQESDLAGHSMNTRWYSDILKICDTHFSQILPLLKEDDIFLVCADHGNNPEIGHNRHTREYVPLLVYKKGTSGIYLGKRDTLADIGATVCDYFKCEPCSFGTSFLPFIQKKKSF